MDASQHSILSILSTIYARTTVQKARHGVGPRGRRQHPRGGRAPREQGPGHLEEAEATREKTGRKPSPPPAAGGRGRLSLCPPLCAEASPAPAAEAEFPPWKLEQCVASEAQPPCHGGVSAFPRGPGPPRGWGPLRLLRAAVVGVDFLDRIEVKSFYVMCTFL